MRSTLEYHMDEIYDPANAHPDEAHNVLMQLIPDGSRVLELGSASGYLSGYMEQILNCRVTGLEFDPAAVEIARQRCTEVHCVDLDKPDALTVAKDSAPYDVLLAAAILEHVHSPERVLLDLHDYLAPGARVIVSLPNVAYWQIRLKLLAGRFDYTDYGIMDRTHLHFYTANTAKALLVEQGYSFEQLYIAGSGLQNVANRLARRFNMSLPGPLLPGLLAYELIVVARKSV